MLNGKKNDAKESSPCQRPFHQFVAPPKAAPKEEHLVVEEAGRDQPERAEGAHDVVGIVLRIIHMGVVL